MIFYLKYLVVIILTSFIFSQSQEVSFESANPFSFNHFANVFVLVSCVLPESISFPIISIDALTFVFF